VSLLARTASRCRRAYILRPCFFFFPFFRCLISKVAERISTKMDIYYFWSELPGHYPHGMGAKSFLGPTLNFDWTYLCNETWYQQLEKNLSIYRDSLTSPKFGELGPVRESEERCKLPQRGPGLPRPKTNLVHSKSVRKPLVTIILSACFTVNDRNLALTNMVILQIANRQYFDYI